MIISKQEIRGIKNNLIIDNIPIKFEKLIDSIGENQYGEYLKKIVNGV